MSTKKSQVVSQLFDKAKPPRGFPKPVEAATLLEQGIVAVLCRRAPQGKVEQALAALKKAYDDWNETRVAQPQELATHMSGSGASKSARDEWVPMARDLRAYLQEVFQKTHGLDLEFLREDPAAGAKLVAQMPELGQFDGTYLLWLAGNGEIPIHAGTVRVLDRMGVVTRTASLKKARSAIEPLAPKGEELLFAATLGHIAERWCDARKPLCHECPMVDDCKYGKKAFADYKVQQARLEAQRKKEEERQRLIEKKENEKRQREDERARKRAEQHAKKLDRERQKREREEAKKRKLAEEKAKRDAAIQAQKEAAAKAKKLEAERKLKEREAARKKAEQDKERARKEKLKALEREKAARAKEKAKQDAKRKAEAEKQRAAQKKAAEAKAAAQKAAAKKAADKKSGPAKPKASASKRPTSAKSAAPKKGGDKAKKATARPKTAGGKKPSGAKKSAGKSKSAKSGGSRGTSRSRR